MKAVVLSEYGSPDVLRYEEIEKPMPSAGEVLVKIHAASANTLDWRRMRAAPFIVRLGEGFFKPNFNILGAEVAGVVEAVGPGVIQLQPGDAVYGEISTGGFAEYAVAKETLLVPKPTEISFEQAAAVPVASLTALQGLRDHGKIQAGQRVLLNGSTGAVGTFAVQIAKSFDVEVTAVCSTGKIDLVRSLGADHIIDYTREDFTQNGVPYDLIFDGIGNRSVADLRRALSHDGTCVIAGFTTLLRLLEHALIGPWSTRNSAQHIGMMGNAVMKQADLLYMNELLMSGKVVPYIDRRYPLREVPDALRYLETKHARGKVVINVEGAV